MGSAINAVLSIIVGDMYHAYIVPEDTQDRFSRTLSMVGKNKVLHI